ncbi:histone-arginine methyltransferase CARM1 [Kwoniella mangroviensis CBS 10435]|uniref:type I protein arginine methyltransferase n=1 Tax=Kwoniella mangroviensis CBS 10435 TaxID=1331196 RepID=A0A1B9IQV6_9TREE|nr:histone-arginine methyltransferase CARM1 [Kwoniella mangroviensis CBS 10435]
MEVDSEINVDGNAHTNGHVATPSKTHADKKEEKNKDHDFYFNFYSSLQNQANMIGDISRTGTYRKAILGNGEVAFKDKIVLDVGAGSGILSYMSAQAGAKEVIALEASSMAEKTEIVSANAGKNNAHLKDRIRIVRGMVEDAKVQEQVLQNGKVDTIISEPIGVMLLHERMVESFILARDLFLKPDGQLLPSAGQIFFCPFSDEGLYNETDQKAQFFNTTLFVQGTDFKELYPAAREEVFAQPVVGMFPPSSLVSTACTPKSFDFYTCTKEDLLEFTIPVDFVVHRTALIHGLASWFDLDFYPRQLPTSEDPNWNYPISSTGNWQWMSQESPLNPGPTPVPPKDGLAVKLSTGPSAARTHWQQARLLLPEPLAANKGERLKGSIHFKVNDARSYDLTLDLEIDRPGPEWSPNPLKRRAEYQLQQQCFNYSYNPDASLNALSMAAGI